jgi:hypothetical protein
VVKLTKSSEMGMRKASEYLIGIKRSKDKRTGMSNEYRLKARKLEGYRFLVFSGIVA